METQHTFSKFTEDTGGNIDTLKDRSAIQKSLCIPEQWARYLKKFSKGKSKVLHLGQNNPTQHYNLEDNEIERSFPEKYLGS